jgi:hypothetical protein
MALRPYTFAPTRLICGAAGPTMRPAPPPHLRTSTPPLLPVFPFFCLRRVGSGWAALLLSTWPGRKWRCSPPMLRRAAADMWCRWPAPHSINACHLLRAALYTPSMIATFCLHVSPSSIPRLAASPPSLQMLRTPPWWGVGALGSPPFHMVRSRRSELVNESWCLRLPNPLRLPHTLCAARPPSPVFISRYLRLHHLPLPLFFS